MRWMSQGREGMSCASFDPRERLRILPQFPQGRLIPPTQIVSRSALPSTPVVAEIPTEIPPPPLSAPHTTSPCSSGTQQPLELLPEMSHVISRASPPNPSRHEEVIRLPHNLVDVNLSRRHDSGVEVREKTLCPAKERADSRRASEIR